MLKESRRHQPPSFVVTKMDTVPEQGQQRKKRQDRILEKLTKLSAINGIKCNVTFCSREDNPATLKTFLAGLAKKSTADLVIPRLVHEAIQMKRTLNDHFYSFDDLMSKIDFPAGEKNLFFKTFIGYQKAIGAYAPVMVGNQPMICVSPALYVNNPFLL